MKSILLPHLSQLSAGQWQGYWFGHTERQLAGTPGANAYVQTPVSCFLLRFLLTTHACVAFGLLSHRWVFQTLLGSRKGGWWFSVELPTYRTCKLVVTLFRLECLSFLTWCPAGSNIWNPTQGWGKRLSLLKIECIPICSMVFLIKIWWHCFCVIRGFWIGTKMNVWPEL